MNIEELRSYCLTKKGVEETLPFGPETLVYKVMGKAFLLTGLESNPIQFNVKCDPEKAIALREQFNCIIPGFHMNKKHWNTVIADGTLSYKQLKEQIDHSYELVIASLTKAARNALEKL
jgi:predicted DNA-binding protein (MmcQ/YjbR family)